MLAIQVSSVDSKEAFNPKKFIILDHRYSLTKDSLKISVLVRDWINIERRSARLLNLLHQTKIKIDEALEKIVMMPWKQWMMKIKYKFRMMFPRN